MTALSVHAVCRRGRFDLDARLEVEAGKTVAVVGPSGAGKTSLVRLVAGVDRLDRGRIVIGDEIWDDPAEGIFVAAERRRTGWVPQGGALFPHLDAAGNVAFGLRTGGESRRVARQRAEDWIDRVGLAGRERAGVGELSGGEARRLALARALAVEPDVLLLDEPFTGLDVTARQELRTVLRRTAGSTRRILVAHEPLDVLAVADRVVVMEGGSVVQAGSPAELCRHPRTSFVADLVGVNLVHGEGGVIDGHPVVDTAAGSLRVADAVSGPVLAVFRPAAVAVYRAPPGGSPRNALEGTVSEVVPMGARVRVQIESHPPVVAELTAEAAAALGLAPGERVYASVKATEIDVSPA